MCRSPALDAYTPRHLAEGVLTTAGALEGERKPVTVLFCDLADSLATAERLGPEGMHRLLDRFFALAVAEVDRYGGTINRFLGDGFMALFGAPRAHEDHARRAVLAAVGIRQSLTERCHDLGQPPGGTLAAHMGLSTGVVVVGKIGDDLRMDYTAGGETTNVAARLQQLALPGTILLTEATRRLVEGYVRVASVGSVEVKGKRVPILAYRVIGLAVPHSPLEDLGERSLSPFVGRERELAGLHDLLADARDGQARRAGLVGEAGMGKSRLLLEFRRSLAGTSVRWAEARCLPYAAAIPGFPTLDVGLRNRCLREARTGPLVLAIEDLQWMDPPAATLVASLIEKLADTPFLLLGTYRPRRRPPWIAGAPASEIALEPLSPRAGLALVEAALREPAAVSRLARRIVSRAGGNPRFLEELARSAEGGGRATPDVDGPGARPEPPARPDRRPLRRGQGAPPDGRGAGAGGVSPVPARGAAKDRGSRRGTAGAEPGGASR